VTKELQLELNRNLKLTWLSKILTAKILTAYCFQNAAGIFEIRPLGFMYVHSSKPDANIKKRQKTSLIF